jgi:hypothetical protein
MERDKSVIDITAVISWPQVLMLMSLLKSSRRHSLKEEGFVIVDHLYC